MTKSPIANRIVFICLLAAAGTSAAAGQNVECPSEISPSSIQVVSVPGWKPFIQFPLFLSSAGMSAGPPESLAVLRGEPLNKKGQPQSTRFEFGDMGFDQGKWLDCRYGEGPQITLSKRLDDSLKECTVTYLKSDRPGKQGIKIVCKQ